MVALLAIVALFTVATLAFGSARDGIGVIGHGAGPQVVATADLYFAVNDMDAQVANVLLIGREQNLGSGREASLQRYEARREQANVAVLQAADLSRDNSAERETIRSLLDGLGRYEKLAAEAILLNEQAGRPPGEPAEEVVELYRRANDLMRLELAPKAYNLTLESGTIVRATYGNTVDQVTQLRWWVGFAGLWLLIVLLGTQIYLAMRFRRTVNAWLLIATIGTATLVVTCVLVLTAASEDLRSAKEEGFDSILAMSRAHAISNSMNADQSGFLLDPERAATHEQVYLEKSQTIFYVPAGNLDGYLTDVEAAVADFEPGADVEFLGFFGDQASRSQTTEEGTALGAAISAYQRFQNADSRMRELAASGELRGAIQERVGPVDEAFGEYDQAMTTLIEVHRQRFDSAVAAGDDGLSGWSLILPAGAGGIALLVVLGVRGRLREYR